jgi:hypothetical protein
MTAGLTPLLCSLGGLQPVDEVLADRRLRHPPEDAQHRGALKHRTELAAAGQPDRYLVRVHLLDRLRAPHAVGRVVGGQPCAMDQQPDASPAVLEQRGRRVIARKHRCARGRVVASLTGPP